MTRQQLAALRGPVITRMREHGEAGRDGDYTRLAVLLDYIHKRAWGPAAHEDTIGRALGRSNPRRRAPGPSPTWWRLAGRPSEDPVW